MVSDGDWYVLVEEDRNHGSNSDFSPDVHRWQLSKERQVADRDAAGALAEELAGTYLPQSPFRIKAGRGRRIYRLPDGTLLVRIRDGSTRIHFRVTVAELVAEVAEVTEVTPPPKRRFFGR
ncbi:hypothetical protein [Kitasatospora sp. NPDC050463]|uniref:hypothetical protein n=1 Tax=Kitasatospora sp. NPDC050463 TaxID=3155786 RepID=UPI0033E82A3E